MIVDARALDVEAVPSEIHHRNAELNALSSALEPLISGDRGDHSIIYGSTGTGKTACSRYTLDELERELVDIRTQYINCFRHSSIFATLYQLVDGVGRSMDIQPHSTPHQELYHRLRDADETPYIVVLDEIDQLEAKDEILYELVSLEHVHLILIANKYEQLFSRLDERVTSRLRGRQPIEFEPYDPEILVEILAKRCDVGLRTGSVAPNVLEEIAETAVGDARVAIQILREAATKAGPQSGTITTDHIPEVEPKAREYLRQKTISQLNRHQRIVYDILQEASEWLPMGEIYPEYVGRVDSPRTQTTVANYLKKMSEYNLVEHKGENRGRRYRGI